MLVQWWKCQQNTIIEKGLYFLAQRQNLWLEQCITSMISTSMYMAQI